MDFLNETKLRAPTVHSKQLTYWDSLPADVLIKIARVQTSLTCAERSPFRVTVPVLFNTVEFEIGNVNERTKWDVVESTVTISARDADSAIPRVEQVLTACGPSLKTVKICRYYHRVRGEDCTPIVSLVEKYCPNVEALVFGRQYSNICTWARLVKRYRSQLRSIRYCQIMLEKLPPFNACTGLLRLCCVFRRSDTLISVLRTVGKTLKELCIGLGGTKESVDVVNAIQTHCRRLSELSLSYRGIETAYTALLCSYGPQLVSAGVEGLSLACLRSVARVCTNLRTSFAYEFYWEEFNLAWYERKWEYVNVIGPLIDDLRLEKYPCTGEESASAMARCVNLRSLHVEHEYRNISDEIMKNMFADSRFKALEDLEIRDFLPSRFNLQLIATSTLNLRKLTFRMMRSIENGDIFESVVDSNPRLTEVTIRESRRFPCDRTADSAVVVLQCLLRIFSRCRKLHITLRVVDEDEVDEKQLRHICQYLSCRRMNLMVRISNSVYEQNTSKPAKEVNDLY